MTEREPRRSRDDTNGRETVVFVNEKRKDGRRRNSGEWKEERKKRGKEGRKEETKREWCRLIGKIVWGEV